MTSRETEMDRDTDPSRAPQEALGRALDWRRSLAQGYIIIAALVASFLAWSAFARLDGAAIAPGVLSAEGSRRTVQHLEGGIVQEILVRDGETVRADQVLIRLDPTRLDTQGDLYSNQLAILLAQEARLMAEFEAKTALVFPEAVMARSREPAVAPVIADQSRLFTSRRDAMLRNLQIAESLLQQLQKDYDQVQVDMSTARETLAQIDAELNALRPLFQRQLVATTRIAPLERERVRLAGVIQGGEVQKLRLDARLAELKLRRQQVMQDYLQDASTILQDVRKQLTDVRQQMLLVGDAQRRGEIRAPIAGTVQQMRYFTVGGVIRPGDAILDIAPASEELVIKARVDPQDIDRVVTGGTAEVKFASFGYWGSEVIRGTLRSISRDRITEDGGKLSYFAAEVVVDKATVPTMMVGKLTAGMAADVLLITGERSVGEYLLGPLLRRWDLSLRER